MQDQLLIINTLKQQLNVLSETVATLEKHIKAANYINETVKPKENIGETLKKYKCFKELTKDTQFINDLTVLKQKFNATDGEFNEVFKSVNLAAQKNNIKDIKLYTFKSINRKFRSDKKQCKVINNI